MADGSASPPARASTLGLGLVLMHYDSYGLPRIAKAVRRSVPTDTPVYFGNYVGSFPVRRPPGRPPPPPADVPGGRRTIVCQIQPNLYYRSRPVSREEAAKLASPEDRRYAGRVPSVRRVVTYSSSARVRWGRELGRRCRDAFRASHRRRPDLRVWQFDEVINEVSSKKGPALRDFYRGILDGLRRGRPVLGDRPMRGIVWATQPALRAAAGRQSRNLRRFWAALERATLAVVGTEFPPFSGSARRVARSWPVGWRALARGGRTQRALARRYMVGMTPGYRLRPGLGGNVKRMPRGWVNAWRRTYINERARHGVAGFAQYFLREENTGPEVIEDTIEALGDGIHVLRRGAR